MQYKDKIDIDEISKYVATLGPETRLYVGCDSEKFKKDGVWVADYITVVIVHKNGKNGCRVFGAVNRERDYDQNKKRPSIRLMTEVYKVSELYIDLKKAMPNHEIEVHLDINPDKQFGSSIVVDQAVGYIRGVCGMIPKIKPEAFAASYAADMFKEKMNIPHSQAI